MTLGGSRNVHDARRTSARAITDMADWRGFGIGGLSVGEAKADMYAMLDVVDADLPPERPRYLMGVGFPEDLIEGVRRGVDLFEATHVQQAIDAQIHRAGGT